MAKCIHGQCDVLDCGEGKCGYFKAKKENPKPRFITEQPQGRFIVDGSMSTNDLDKYLQTNPHPDYTLVTCNRMPSGNWYLIWELK